MFLQWFRFFMLVLYCPRLEFCGSPTLWEKPLLGELSVSPHHFGWIPYRSIRSVSSGLSPNRICSTGINRDKSKQLSARMNLFQFHVIKAQLQPAHALENEGPVKPIRKFVTHGLDLQDFTPHGHGLIGVLGAAVPQLLTCKSKRIQ